MIAMLVPMDPVNCNDVAHYLQTRDTTNDPTIRQLVAN